MIKIQSTINANPAKDFNDFASNLLNNEPTTQNLNSLRGELEASNVQNNLRRLRPGQQPLLDTTPRIEGDCKEWPGLDTARRFHHGLNRPASGEDTFTNP